MSKEKEPILSDSDRANIRRGLCPCGEVPSHKYIGSHFFQWIGEESFFVPMRGYTFEVKCNYEQKRNWRSHYRTEQEADGVRLALIKRMEERKGLHLCKKYKVTD